MAEQRIQQLETQLQTMQQQFQQLQSAVPQQPQQQPGPFGTVRLEKPEPYSGKYDAATVTNFLYKCELYFGLTGLQTDQQRVGFATLLLQGDAAIWLRAKYTSQQIQAESWQNFCAAFTKQFMPPDSLRRARDTLAACTQTGNILGYNNAFRRALVVCTDVSKEEALDKYLRGLKKDLRQVVLLHDPSTFDEAAKLAERAASANYVGGQKPQIPRPNQQYNGPVPMDIGTMGGSSSYSWRGRQRGNTGNDRGRYGGFGGYNAGNRGRNSGQGGRDNGNRGRDVGFRGRGGRGGQDRRCYLCGEYGHFRRNCPHRGRFNEMEGSPAISTTPVTLPTIPEQHPNPLPPQRQ